MTMMTTTTTMASTARPTRAATRAVTTARPSAALTARVAMRGKSVASFAVAQTAACARTGVITRAAYTHTNKKGLSQFVERVGAGQMKNDLIPFRVGMTVKVGVTVIEGAKTRKKRCVNGVQMRTRNGGARARVQPYEGVVIAIHRSGVASTVTVRKSMQGFGVERVFPIHSPLCTFQEVRGAGKPVVRRAKLFYLRNLVGKQAKLKTRFVAKKEGLSRFEVKMQALRAEEAAAQAKADAAAAAAAAAEAAAAAAAEAPAAEESA
uniref:Ribosomal protein L19 n=2 Tax=Ostreococcus mediterraneus TaxID=1486918 RepID=A0A7S0ZA31_9CHLO|mmetsp:Transcript_9198/g.20800  ORF Transcript_9198/g.20800 Transcript_9198/m.20800 type:complete len:265 (+) Transcript_9198:88-882(+)